MSCVHLINLLPTKIKVIPTRHKASGSQRTLQSDFKSIKNKYYTRKKSRISMRKMITRVTLQLGPCEFRQICGGHRPSAQFYIVNAWQEIVWPWKWRWRSRCTTFTMTPFDSDINHGKSHTTLFCDSSHCFRDITVSNLWPWKISSRLRRRKRDLHQSIANNNQHKCHTGIFALDLTLIEILIF